MAGGEETLSFVMDHPHLDFDMLEELYEPLRLHMESGSIRGTMGETAVNIFSI